MSYLVYCSLEITAGFENIEDICKYLVENEESYWPLNASDPGIYIGKGKSRSGYASFGSRESVNRHWYEQDELFIELSKMFSTAEFVIEEVGEDQGDISQCKYVNGFKFTRYATQSWSEWEGEGK